MILFWKLIRAPFQWLGVLTSVDSSPRDNSRPSIERKNGREFEGRRHSAAHDHRSPSDGAITKVENASAGASHVEIVAGAKVLTLLERQLSEVSKDMESSVLGVCSSFQGMANRAQQAVQTASESVVQSKGKSGESPLLVEMGKVLATLLDSVEQSCDFSNQVSQRLLLLENRLAQVEATVEEVEEISNRAKLVALNGQIEAARLGEAGKAFQVVAEETKLLASNAARTSDSIRNSINELSTELKQTSSEIQDRSQKDLENFHQKKELSNQLLNDLANSHQRVSTSLGKTAAISGELREEIGKAVMSMQFQDRLSQRIAHVMETLESLSDQIQSQCRDVSEREVERRFSEWVKRLNSQSTMDSERKVMMNHRPADAEPSEAEFSVELF